MLYADYVGLLKQRKPFAFSRWGDGEWACLLGHSGANCDDCRYSGPLRAALTAILESRPKYYLGMQNLVQRYFGPEIRAWLARRGLKFKWENADVFARASQSGQIAALAGALEQRTCVLVGPAHLASLPFVAAHVVIPGVDCFDEMRSILPEIKAVLDEAVNPLRDPVIVVSAGMAAGVIVHRFATTRKDATVIDFGSLWEPYVGLKTRTYHKGILRKGFTLCA